jgi:hypothetical protein
MFSAGRHRLARRSLLSTFVGVLVCVVVAAPVWAFASRSTHVAVVPGGGPGSRGVTFGSSTATCPSGQHVLFGGFKNGLAGMRRTANNRWTVYGVNFTPPPAGSAPIGLYSMAYCGYGPVASKATSTVVVRDRSSVYQSGSATARCPAGTVVVAGGFATTPDVAVIVTALERVAADLWRVAAYLGTGTSTALTAIAYCGPGPAPKLVSRTMKNYVSGPVPATCPTGKRLVFGGAIVTPSPGSVLQTMRAKNQRTWTVGGIGEAMTALAYCR